MDLFFATCSRHDITPIKNLRYKNVLSSYFYYRKGKYREYYLKNKHLYDNFFMDSGAFSFHNLKVDIDIDEYIDTIKKDSIDNYSVLDVIGDPKATQENYLYMKSKDLDPTPCFHINTDVEYLDYYLEECDKLAIGGMVQAQNIHSNLKKIWSKIWSKNKTMKVHGFGVSSPDIAVSYPWHSIDSSSFAAITKFARASAWDKETKNFKVINSFDLLKTYTLAKEKQTEERKTLGGVVYTFLLYWQMEQYNQMIDWINKEQENKNWNNLTAQMTMF